MNREETRAAAEVMLHFADGGKAEGCERRDGIWLPLSTTSPVWDWQGCDYRKAQPKVSRYRRYVIRGSTKEYLFVETCSEHDSRGISPTVIEHHIDFIRWIDTEWKEAE